MYVHVHIFRSFIILQFIHANVGICFYPYNFRLVVALIVVKPLPFQQTAHISNDSLVAQYVCTLVCRNAESHKSWCSNTSFISTFIGDENIVVSEDLLCEVDFKDVSEFALINGNIRTPLNDSSNLLVTNASLRVERNVNHLRFYGPLNVERYIVFTNRRGNTYLRESVTYNNIFID